MVLSQLVPLVVIAALCGSFVGATEEVIGASYGLDCSWPIHTAESSCGDLLGDRKAIYDEYLRGCAEKWGAKGTRCYSDEEDRLVINRRQPQSMVVSDASLNLQDTNCQGECTYIS